MGSAEQRQAERGGHADVQDATRELSRRYAGPLGHIRKRRDILDDREQRVRGAHKGLRAAVGMVIHMPDAPSDAEVLDAAGWTPEQLAAFREELRVGPRTDDSP